MLVTVNCVAFDITEKHNLTPHQTLQTSDPNTIPTFLSTMFADPLVWKCCIFSSYPTILNCRMYLLLNELTAHMQDLP